MQVESQIHQTERWPDIYQSVQRIFGPKEKKLNQHLSRVKGLTNYFDTLQWPHNVFDAGKENQDGRNTEKTTETAANHRHK